MGCRRSPAGALSPASRARVTAASMRRRPPAAGGSRPWPSRRSPYCLYFWPVPEASDHHGEIDGLPVFWRSAEPPAGTGTPLYVHGGPTSSDESPRFLERSGGIAPDLPGFGRSGKPGYLSFTMEEYDHFLERFLDEREIERV